MWNSTLSRREKYTVTVLSCIAFALYIPLALRPPISLSGMPYCDDAYYLFSIARNIAAGHGPTVDGLHLTNGFQPLLVLLYTPIFWLCSPLMTGHADAWLAVRWTFILNGVIAALAVWPVALLMRALERTPQKNALVVPKISAPVIGAALWVGTFQIFTEMSNGLETGLSSLMLLIALLLYVKLQTNTVPKRTNELRGWVALGAMLGLAVLARIDSAIFAAIVVIMLILNRRYIRAFTTGGIALLVSAPWWIFNLVSFGSLMPSSGQAENSWPLPAGENIRHAYRVLSDILTFIFYLPGSFGTIARLGWILFFIFGIVYVCYRTHLIKQLRTSFHLHLLLPFSIFSFVLLIYYTFFFKAPHFILRYLQPGRMLWFILIVASVSLLWNGKTARWAIVGLAIIGLAFTIQGYTDKYFPALQASDFYGMGVWAEQHPEEKIAMLQSGLTSFMSPNVINLDGKVNTGALRAHLQGHLGAYLRDEQFTYIADWKPFIEDIDTIARKDELYYDSSGMIGGIQLMKRRMSRP
jgi:hypothetical protein